MRERYNSFKELEYVMIKNIGKEAILDFKFRDTEILGYLPEDWTVDFFISIAKTQSELIEKKFANPSDFSVGLMAVDEFLDQAEDRVYALAQLHELRDNYIKDFLND